MKTEPGKYYKNLKAQKWINRPSRKSDLKKIIDEAKATDSELYASLQNDPSRYVDVMNYRLGDTTKPPKDYPKTITKIYDSPMGTIKEIKKVKKPKKVAEAKPNGKYKMPELNLDSFDWDQWLRKNDPNYITLEEEDKLVSQPSIDESNAVFWENFFYDYKRKGGELNFKDFQQLMQDQGDIGDLGAKKRKGIRGILLA